MDSCLTDTWHVAEPLQSEGGRMCSVMLPTAVPPALVLTDGSSLLCCGSL